MQFTVVMLLVDVAAEGVMHKGLELLLAFSSHMTCRKRSAPQLYKHTLDK